MTATRRKTRYGGCFYERRDASTRPSAEAVIPLVLELMEVRSVVELGCGVGTWLDVFRGHGVQDILGFEGHWLDPDSLVIPTDRFRHHDLRKPLDVARRFDLAVSLEVAEHLPESASGTLIDSLTDLAPVVLFSAAVPFQGGRHHLNEQWPDYWADLFQIRDYRVADPLRPRLWRDERVRPWYVQNLLLFVEDRFATQLGADSPLARALERTASDFLALAHPSLYERNSDPTRWSLRTVLRVFPHLLKRAVARRMFR